MSLKLTALCLLLGVAGSFASSSSSSSSSSSGSTGSCSAPPASLEVCLSSVFGTLESALASISASLKKHEVTMHSELGQEFQVLSSEVAGIHDVYKVAASVRSVVDSDYSALDEQIEALNEEKYHLKYLLSKFVAQLDLLVEEKKSVSEEIQIVYEEFASAKKANWNMNKQMSAVGKAKAVIVKQEADAQTVINKLVAEIAKIKGKVGQMNKRQDWLLSWQEKLSGDLSAFVSDVNKFKDLESDLAKRIKNLKIEQASLLADAQSIELNMASLSEHYNKIAEYLSELVEYESQLEVVREKVDNQETLFSYAASDFSCEAELLKAEACNSTPAKPAAKPAAAAAATAAKAAVATAAKTGAAVATAAKAAVATAVKAPAAPAAAAKASKPAAAKAAV